MRLLAPNAASLFALAVIVPTLGGLAFEIARDPSVLIAELPIWILLVAVVELLPAPAWPGVQVGLGIPLLISVAILYAPVAAALAALLGSSDTREYRREIAPLTAVFNRCQVALAVMGREFSSSFARYAARTSRETAAPSAHPADHRRSVAW